MSESPTIDSSTYLSDRVEDQLKYYQTAANQAKSRFIRMQYAIITISLIVPVVVNLPSTMGGFDLSAAIKVTATVLSLSLAILNGWLNFGKFGDLWLSFRMTEEVLKQEKFLFLARSGRYQDEETAFAKFVEAVESIISSEHNKFQSLIDEARRPKKAPEKTGEGSK